MNGKVTYLGRHGSLESLRKYEEIVAGLPKPEIEPALPEPVSGETVTVKEIVLRYYQHAQAYYVKPVVKSDGTLAAKPDGTPETEPTGEHISVRRDSVRCAKNTATCPRTNSLPRNSRSCKGRWPRWDGAGTT